MPKRLTTGTDETGTSIQIDKDIVSFVVWHEYEEIHAETMTLGRFKQELGL